MKTELVSSPSQHYGFQMVENSTDDLEFHNSEKNGGKDGFLENIHYFNGEEVAQMKLDSNKNLSVILSWKLAEQKDSIEIKDNDSIEEQEMDFLPKGTSSCEVYSIDFSQNIK